MNPQDRLLDRFTEKATAVSAVVEVVADLNQALAYTVDLCRQKQACQLLLSGCQEDLSGPAELLCEGKPGKVIAAPNLGVAQIRALSELCAGREITVISDGLRGYLGGVDIGLTVADYGIAETGTLVLDSRNEEVRLATMVSEVHVAVLPADRLRASALQMQAELETCLQAPPGYLAFITGASRTADIERVLALGVHGPLELVILVTRG